MERIYPQSRHFGWQSIMYLNYMYAIDHGPVPLSCHQRSLRFYTFSNYPCPSRSTGSIIGIGKFTRFPSSVPGIFFRTPKEPHYNSNFEHGSRGEERPGSTVLRPGSCNCKTLVEMRNCFPYWCSSCPPIFPAVSVRSCQSLGINCRRVDGPGAGGRSERDGIP